MALQYSSIRSTITQLYKLAHVLVLDETTHEINMFLTGTENTIKSTEQQFGLKISKGKKPTSYTIYSMLVKRLIIGDVCLLFKSAKQKGY